MKKKTATAILLTPAIMLMVMGFNTVPASNVSAEETTSTAEVNSTISISADSIEYKGQSFSGLDDLQSALDKANSVSKFAPGYPFEMEEKNSLYYFDELSKKDDTYGLGIATFDNNGTETVLQIFSHDPNSKTSKGIHPGSTKDELIAAYGEPTEISDNFYIYDFEKFGLNFIVKNDIVTMISSEHPDW